VNAITWPRSRAAEALTVLARVAKLPTARAPAAEGQAIERLAGQLGLEAEPIGAAYADIDALLAGAGPALLVLPGDRLLALLESRGRRLAVVGPDHRVTTTPTRAVRDALCEAIDAGGAPAVDAVLLEAQVPARRRARARAALLRESFAGHRIDVGYMLRPAMRAPAAAHVRWARLVGRVGLLAVAHAAQYALGILGWWLVGKGALEGRIDRGWLLAWGLVLFSQVPFRLLASWSQGVAALEAGALLKQRLLAGAVQLPADAVRTQGAGQLLGCILESEAVESLALSGGFTGTVALVELVAAGVILTLGAGGLLHLVLLVATVAGSATFAWRYFRRRAAWTDSRLAMTHDLVERMVGHRTRLAQQHPARWHDGEDSALERYLELARRMDAGEVRLVAMVPRGWIVVGLLGLVPAFASGASTLASLAIAVGGVVLAYQALRKMTLGLASLAGAVIAWRAVAPIFQAAGRAELPRGTEPSRGRGDREVLLEASELVFRYRTQGDAVLRGCTLRLGSGDRVLLEGSSGGGKSTLGSVLAGLREPESGLLLVDGLDKQTLGQEGWRARVVAAPQFHENHVFASSFAFNLLMGRAWPPQQADLDLAETICVELGLGPLLQRMPAGLLQMVGETGWQLSHGERSRLFVARALLQEGEVVVLDESFAALDPHTLRLAMDCVLARANALLVIAHP
jgi:ATP-binding cassette, subfamily B, bacterial